MKNLKNNEMVILNGGGKDEACALLGGATLASALMGGSIWFGVAFIAFCTG